MSRFFFLIVVLICSLSECAQRDNFQGVSVHVVFSNHLDVGFDGIDPIPGFAVNVINRYFDVYIPRAISTSNTLKQQNNTAYIWTTHSWVLSMYLSCPPSMGLHCPAQAQIEETKQAIYDGYITWHAYPFNAEVEVMDRSLASFGFELTHDLDDEFELPRKRTISQRDVPGTTVALIPIMAQNNITAISFGVNGASAPPVVPGGAFVWSFGSSSVMATSHGGGYGGIGRSDALIVDGLDHVLVMDWKGDNAGPHTPEEALADFNQLQAEFPGATIFASTFDAYFAELEKIKDTLPVVTSEVGDTWIYGIASDPLKLSSFRALNTIRSDCLSLGFCDANDHDFKNFSRLLIKGAEHTWGGDVKTFLDASHQTLYEQWSKEAFSAIVSTPAYQSLIGTWFEQRLWCLDFALSALPDQHYIRQAYDKHVEKQTPREPNADGYVSVDLSGPLSFVIESSSSSSTSVEFSRETGALISLKRGDQEWANEQNPLGLFIYDTFDEADFTDFLSSYMNCDFRNDCTWAFLDFGKVNVSNASPVSQSWNPSLTSLYYRSSSPSSSSSSSSSSNTSFIIWLSLPDAASTQYGAPPSISIELTITVTSPSPSSSSPSSSPSSSSSSPCSSSSSSSSFLPSLGLDYRLTWFNKPASRLPEALWFAFEPQLPTGSSSSVVLSKLDSFVSGVDIVVNGSSHLHSVSSVCLSSTTTTDDSDSVSVSDTVSSFLLSSPSCPLVSVGRYHDRFSPFPPPMNIQEMDGGTKGQKKLAVNLENNIWGTNYVMWYPFTPLDTNFTAFFSVNIP